MTTDVLEQDPVQLTQKARPVYGYYRKPNGDIGVNVTSPMERLKYITEGWTPLPQYGLFDMTTGYAADHPFEALFMHGGAHELSARQCLANGFHVKTPQYPRCKTMLSQNHKKHGPTCLPLIDVELPQIAGAETFPCDMCETVLPSARVKNKHERISHKQEKSNSGIGDAIAKALAQALGKGPGAIDLDALKGVTFTKSQTDALVKAGVIVQE